MKIHLSETEFLKAELKRLQDDMQALAAPVQEPVHQWQQKHSPYWYDGYPDNDDGGGPYETRTLYTTPPAAQRQWVGLTDDEIEKLRESFATRYAIEAIEAKLKEKNT
jgi:hypothetical protein